MIKLPELPMHPDPHTYRWTERERITIIEYAAAVSAADNAALREVVEGAAAADEFLENPEAIYRLARMARAALGPK